MKRDLMMHQKSWDIWGKNISTPEDIFHMRGFVLTADNQLDATIHNENDEKYFSSFSATQSINEKHRTFYNLSKITKDLSDTERRWSYGMSGSLDHPNVNSKANVPLEFLDPPLALLVKVLPLLGIHTNYSCSGHLKENPYLCFKSQDDLMWMKNVLNALYSKDIVDKKFVFRYEFGWMGNKLEFVTNAEGLNSHYDAYHLSVSIGKLLLDSNTRQILNYFRSSTL